jgi:hypothetical protein
MAIWRPKALNPNRVFEQLKERAAKARKPYDKDTWLNLAFYLDEQYVEWNDDIANLRIIPRPDTMKNVPRPVVNKIMHFTMQEHAMALQDKPNVDVLPPTDDPIDASMSEVTLSYLRWLSEPSVGNFDSTLSQAVLWALIAGEGFIKWVYNPRLNRPDFLSVSPLDVYPDPYATDFRKCRYVIHSQFMDVEAVYDQYGVEVPADQVQKADEIRTSMLRDMGSAPVLEGVTVNELWYKPSRRHPHGIYAVWAGHNQLVEPAAFPYKHAGEPRLPFTQLGSIPRPNSQHYAAPVKYLRSGQMELNKYHAQKIMMREAFANLKWWIPAELELEHDPDDSTRQILTGNSQNGQLRPEILVPPSLPDTGDGAWITEEMMHVVGLHEVSQAQVPGRVEAAKAIELLKESDVSRQSELRDTIKFAISEGFWQLLMLAKQYVSTEQIAVTYSREGVPEVRRFKTDNWKPGLRVQVTQGTGLARSRAARQDQAMLLWQNQIIRDPEVMSELLDLPVPNLVSSKAFDIKLARNENYEMARGTPIVPNSWDDHDIHIREHNSYRKTHEFLQLPTKTKTKYEFHVTKHEDLQTAELVRVAKQQAAVQAALMPQPAPGPADQTGTPPAPAPADQPQQGQSATPAEQAWNTPQAMGAQQDRVEHWLSKAGRPA